MKKLKKALRLFVFVLLIILASSGLGGIPIMPAQKKEEGAEIEIELNETTNEQQEIKDFDIYKI